MNGMSHDHQYQYQYQSHGTTMNAADTAPLLPPPSPHHGGHHGGHHGRHHPPAVAVQIVNDGIHHSHSHSHSQPPSSSSYTVPLNTGSPSSFATVDLALPANAHVVIKPSANDDRPRAVSFHRQVHVSLFSSSPSYSASSCSSSSTATTRSARIMDGAEGNDQEQGEDEVEEQLPVVGPHVYRTLVSPLDPLSRVLAESSIGGSPLASVPGSPLLSSANLLSSPLAAPPTDPPLDGDDDTYQQSRLSQISAPLLADLRSLAPALAACFLFWVVPDLIFDSSHAAPLRLPFRISGAFLLVAVGVMTSSRFELTFLVLLAIALLAITGTAACGPDARACGSSKEAVSALLDGYSDPIQWLVLASFQLGLAVQHTGLGHRICTYLLKLTTARDTSTTSTSPLPIAYTLLLCEYLLALFIPSNTARGAGIMSPIISSLAASSSAHLYDFWHLIGAYANILSAAAHMTGTAGGPMIARMLNTYLDMDIRPVQWSVGALGPWCACAAGLPWVVAWMVGVDLRRGGGGSSSGGVGEPVGDDEESRPLVAVDPSTTPPGSPMSPVSYYSSSSASSSSDPCASPTHASFTPAQSNAQLLLVLVLIPTLALWSFSPLDPSAPAFLSLVLLLLLHILPLSAILAHTQAWDTFLWLGGFLTLSTQLEWAGVTHVLGAGLARILPAHPAPAMLVAAAVNMATMYLFSSLTAHAAVVAPPVLAAVAHAITAGRGDAGVRVPWAVGMCMAMTLVLCGLLTPYSTGSVAMYAGKSGLGARRWVQIGAVVGGLAVGVGVVGVGAGAWWWVIGWWGSEQTVV